MTTAEASPEVSPRPDSGKPPVIKTCRICGLVGDATLFRANSRRCLPCSRKQGFSYHRRYYEKNKEQAIARAKAHYEANKKLKGKRPQTKEEKRTKRLAWRCAHYQANKDKILAQQRAWFEENKEKMEEWSREHCAKDEVKKRRAEQQAEYRRLHPGRSKTPEAKQAHNGRNCKYRKTPMGKLSHLHSAHRRRAAKNDTVPRATRAEMAAVKAAAKGICHYCRKKFGKLTYDHVIPIGRRGPHAGWNLVMACGSCNSSKGAKPPEQFAKELGLLLI